MFVYTLAPTAHGFYLIIMDSLDKKIHYNALQMYNSDHEIDSHYYWFLFKKNIHWLYSTIFVREINYSTQNPLFLLI